MLIFDQLKKNDPHLRLLAAIIFVGLTILLVGLWWVQVVSAREYQAHLETQSFQTIRVPAVRGKILDRNGIVLAENRPVYNVNLYLEELRQQFQKEYARLRPKKIVTNSGPFWEKWFGGGSVKTDYVKMTHEQVDDLEWQARYNVAYGAMAEISRELQKPLSLSFAAFKRHYTARLFMPLPLVENIDARDIARFEEQSLNVPGANLDIQSMRYYPYQTTAAHLLGYLHKDNRSDEGEDASFDYRLPDYRGAIGLEYAYDTELHGRAGEKSVLVNSLGYRQSETVWSPVQPGTNIFLTIDLHIQQGVERALKSAAVPQPVRGAAVVMDVNTGDILAMASSPTFDPNDFVQGMTRAEYQKIQSLTAEKNRATQENYQPGSIFKPIVGLACLENGMDPKALYKVQPDPEEPWHGAIFVGRRKIKDTAPPGLYDFKKALIHSSNSYFISNGLSAGVEKIVEMGRRFHLGEPIGLGTLQETAGTFPDAERLSKNWFNGNTANLCIGQGYIDVTPLQMTVVAAAIANGGKVLWPRLVDRMEPQEMGPNDHAIVFPKGRVRDHLGVKRSSLAILENAMLADTEDPEGTAYAAFRNWPHQKTMHVCAKTGTAEIMDTRNRLTGRTTWLLSFAPFEHPRYAVVVMIEDGGSGGGTCAPVARKIYETLVEREQMNVGQGNTVAAN
ncbi:MAG TPA: penicillin-binding transpeptidase domain-containing protein [Verrucomicrobiae bacterium]|nr:penicillin-binding transpeptidase domain-containing protein [Verrucomicrobiae bacterium]